MPNTILVADDDTSVIAALHLLLKTQGFEVVAVTTPEALLEQVEQTEFCAALIDLNYQNDTTSGQEGLALIKQIKAIDELLPVIVMTGYSSVDIAVEAMKLGAADFVQKPWGNERLLHLIRTQISLTQAQRSGLKLAQENAILKHEIQISQSHIVVHSSAMKQLMAQLHKLAQSDMSILLVGENGCGKSLFAQYVHENSPRQNAPFIAVNMGAIAETLFESEMFGHIKGAFTDAKESRIGRFELAQKGSIFLDEIANISIHQQAKLLRVLEERQFEKVGSNKTQQVDVRLISATNANIEDIVQSGAFRQDLLYRLNTVVIHIPALRERKEDVLPLAEMFLSKYAGKYHMPTGLLSESAKQALLAYQWPGNIRELSHVIERAMFLRQAGEVQVHDLALSPLLPTEKTAHVPSQTNPDWQTMSLDDIEKTIIQERLSMFENNPNKTAESLGLSRSAYYRRLEKYDIGQ